MSSCKQDETIEGWLVRVSGHVQGVGYRDACVRRARALGITGWVRNRLDGSVEMTLQGPSKPLADMCHWLRHGISTARVEELEVTVVQPPLARFENFDRLPTL